ncbi:SH3 domain-containing protein [Pedobacter frigiditerrae]|uniref:SH3 domain-containing protein n=1 Tax=Pedobacter frigiditerrae TaxID=2530452 RepID=A0A4R0MRI0_9SPHI|nr:SH3 domain-containing protein [Pedobacter frigiditerrae]TCC89515.1 SH3 domain-containing protein [Pedobacter frigiditerrae]
MMNRFFSLLISLVLFSFSVNGQDLYKVTADKLNVRETKDPSSKKIGFVPQDENVQVLDSTDAKYFKIKVTNGEGWVSKDFLQRISPEPVKQPQVQKVVVEQKTSKDNSKLFFISFIVLVMIALLYFIFKFLNSKILMAISTCIVLAVGYLSYLNFIVEKSVSGKYVSIGDGDYQSFEFKPANAVVIEDTYTDTLITTKYDVEGDMIKFKQQENTILLLIRDNNTLVGEGFTRGTFKKN